MQRRFFSVILFIVLYNLPSFSQQIADNFLIDNNKAILKTAGVKSKTIWEYFYNIETGQLKDSLKLMSFYFDNEGNTVERTKFHIFDELNLKETYQYDASGKVKKISRYNKNDDVIETNSFKYNKNGKLVRERIVQYYNNPNASFYFSILASVHDDSIFSRLQDDLLIEPRLEGYTITINLTDNDPQNHFVVIGDEDDPTSMRFSWSQLSLPVQKGLLAWDGNNRTNHKYVVQNLAKVSYTYDKNSNLALKTYYNTAENIVKRELFFFDENGRNIGYEKYNAGKLLNKESFSYDEYGNVKEAFYTGGRTEYSYDDSNKIIEKTVYNTSNVIFSRTVYSYLNGKLTEETVYGPDDLISGRTTYTYDEKGNIVTKTFYNSENILERESKAVYEFYF